MRRKCFWLMGLVAMMLAASGGYSQFPGDGNPDEFFYKLSNGKEVLVRSEMTPFSVGFFDRIADKLGIKGEEITKGQFEQYMVARQAERSGGGPGDIKVVVDPKAADPKATTPAAGTPAPAAKPLSESEARWADSLFQRGDKNTDGLLSYDELSDTLKQEREKWDTNKDGFIDRDEYRLYFQARSQQQRSDRPGGNSGNSTPSATTTPEPPPAPKPPEVEAKPVVYRAGKLPADIPAWFAQLDTDGDGQVGLYEWKTSGKTMDEFNKLDRNGDGFLTIAEVVRPTTTALASATPAPTKTAPPSASDPRSGGSSRPSGGNSSSGGSGGWGSFFQRPSGKGK